MSEAYRHYLEIVANLRTRRLFAGWKPEDDRADLKLLLELLEEMSPEERRAANDEGHRS